MKPLKSNFGMNPVRGCLVKGRSQTVCENEDEGEDSPRGVDGMTASGTRDGMTEY